jgi:hypothetical protein
VERQPTRQSRATIENGRCVILCLAFSMIDDNTAEMIASMHDYDTLLTAREAARELNLAVSSVQSMVSRGTLQTVETRFGNLITVESVDAYRNLRLGKPGRKAVS